jgi:hypothetical protein
MFATSPTSLTAIPFVAIVTRRRLNRDRLCSDLSERFVAAALALKYPDLVKGLVLASGYYYPTLRLDVIPTSFPAVPLIGNILRHTLLPIIGRVIWPLLMRKIFGLRLFRGTVGFL